MLIVYREASKIITSTQKLWSLEFLDLSMNRSIDKRQLN